MDLKGSNLTKGKDCFKLFNRGVVETLEIIKREQLYTPSPQKEENIILAYDQYYSKVQSDLGHYFKTLFRLVRFIDEAQHFSGSEDNVMEQKKFYTGILRAQLSTYEEILMAYNAVGQYGKKFRLLIQKYDLLKNCDYSKVENGDLIKLKINSDRHL
jgi:hypothetical protein